MHKLRLLIVNTSADQVLSERVRQNLANFFYVEIYPDVVVPSDQAATAALLNRLDRVDILVVMMNGVEAGGETEKVSLLFGYHMGLMVGKIGLGQVFVLHDQESEEETWGHLYGIHLLRFAKGTEEEQAYSLTMKCEEIKLLASQKFEAVNEGETAFNPQAYEGVWLEIFGNERRLKRITLCQLRWNIRLGQFEIIGDVFKEDDSWWGRFKSEFVAYYPDQYKIAYLYNGFIEPLDTHAIPGVGIVNFDVVAIQHKGVALVGNGSILDTFSNFSKGGEVFFKFERLPDETIMKLIGKEFPETESEKERLIRGVRELRES